MTTAFSIGRASALVGLLVSVAAPARGFELDATRRGFVENRGVFAKDAGYATRLPGRSVWLTDDGIVWTLPGNRPDSPDHRLALTPVASRRPTQPRGAAGITARLNVLRGRRSMGWSTNLPVFREVEYRDLFAGVSLRIYRNERELKYDFILAPHADPGNVEMAFSGADGVSIAADGRLLVSTAVGAEYHSRPIAYQRDGYRTRLVDVRYRCLAAASGATACAHTAFGFDVGDYDPNHPLTIDPTLSYSTCIGGASGGQNTWIHDIAVNGSGEVYAIGQTDAADLLLQDPWQATLAGSRDAFIAKISSDGTSLLYSTYLGGDGMDQGNAIALDSSGNIHVTGITDSSDFPLQNEFQNTGTNLSAFVTKLSPAGDALLFSTYMGGSDSDYGEGVAVASGGDVFVGFSTQSNDFPTLDPFQTNHGGGLYDVGIVRLGSAGGLEYGTFLGGTGDDYFGGLAVDPLGRLHVTGSTSTNDFPTQSPVQGFAGVLDAFVTVFTAAGDALVFSTFHGGSENDLAHDIAIDDAGNIVVVGRVRDFAAIGGGFPIQNALQPSYGGGDFEGFIFSLTGAGALRYSTFFGGDGDDIAYTLALSHTGQVVIAGDTSSSNLTTVNPYQATYQGGSWDAFASVISADGSTVDFSTYLGGGGYERGEGVAAAVNGTVYVSGKADAGFPELNEFYGCRSGASYVTAFADAADPCVPLGGTDTTCDGVDDDCDGSDDEDYVPDASCGIGFCLTGNTPSSCNGGVETPCAPGSPLGPTDPTCDGIDDDCDGSDDDEYPPDASCGVGVCLTGNTPSSCNAGAETPCAPGDPLGPTDPTCDGVDDDCDGNDDDEYTPDASCGVGVCLTGNTPSSCNAGAETPCAPGDPLGPTDPTCDGVDDDCDGNDDDEYAPDASCGVGVCLTGNTPSSCNSGVETPCAPGSPLGPTDPTCDGVDDDCDGNDDDEYAPDASCGVGVCLTGNTSSSCNSGVETPCAPGSPLGPTDPTCDGVDDDCDGFPDEDTETAGACLPSDTCATARCNVALGACEQVPITGCCSEHDDCTTPSACVVGACVTADSRCNYQLPTQCCATDAECDDGNSCTTDRCNLATGQCELTAVPGCCASSADCDDRDLCSQDLCHPQIQRCYSRPATCETHGPCGADSSCAYSSLLIVPRPPPGEPLTRLGRVNAARF